MKARFHWVRHWFHGHYFTPSQHCFSAEELILIHGLASNSSGVNRSALARLSPALIQQILSGACAHITEPAHPDDLDAAHSKCVCVCCDEKHRHIFYVNEREAASTC